MKSPFRFIIYLCIGLGLYYFIESGESTISHDDARKGLIFAIIGVFALLLVVKVMKQRHQK